MLLHLACCRAQFCHKRPEPAHPPSVCLVREGGGGHRAYSKVPISLGPLRRRAQLLHSQLKLLQATSFHTSEANDHTYFTLECLLNERAMNVRLPPTGGILGKWERNPSVSTKAATWNKRKEPNQATRENKNTLPDPLNELHTFRCLLPQGAM